MTASRCVACGRPTPDPHDDHYSWCPNRGHVTTTVDCTCAVTVCDACCSCKENTRAV